MTVVFLCEFSISLLKIEMDFFHNAFCLLRIFINVLYSTS